MKIFKYGKVLKKALETAKRCNAMIFVNARFKTEIGYKNTAYAFDRNGEIAGSAIVRYDDIMPYPIVFAHRGFNTIAPDICCCCGGGKASRELVERALRYDCKNVKGMSIGE